MKIVAAILLGLFLLLQYRLWLGEGSFMKVWQLREALEAQQAENQRLEERNRALQAEVRDLKQGVEAIEERARTELGMVREGETFYQVVEQ